MVLSGIGAGINELTALAGTAELAPTSRRGVYVAALIFTVIPFCPSVMWAQLIAAYPGWRYVGLLTSLWTLAGFFIIFFFYFPPPRVNSRGLAPRETVTRIDFVGGFLSVVGIILFDAGLLWGGYQVSHLSRTYTYTQKERDLGPAASPAPLDLKNNTLDYELLFYRY